MMIAVLIAASGLQPTAQAPAPSPLSIPAGKADALPAGRQSCDGSSDVVVVCGRSNDRFRLDPGVLEAMRARDALPPKPPVVADGSADIGCVGPQACRGDFIPLVGMALAAAKVAVLAAEGEDWRSAIRTHEDEYRLKKQAEERRARDRRPQFGFAANR